jgi:hypothetical protein
MAVQMANGAWFFEIATKYNSKGTSLVRPIETHDRRRIRLGIALLIAIVLIFCMTFAWHQGIVSQRPAYQPLQGSADKADQNRSRYVVGGISMVPTMFPRHARVRCDTCRLRYAVDEDTDCQRAICFHCGAPIQNVGVGTADIVSVQPILKSHNFEVGEILLIDSKTGPAIKRVFAVAKQTVKLDGMNLINQEHPGLNVSPDTWIPVDHDSSRSISRWKALDNDPSNPSLVYHHLSINDHQLPSPVYDDVPFNAGHSRRLFLASQLRLRGRYIGSQPTTLRFAGWVDGPDKGQIRFAELQVAPHSDFQWTIQYDPRFVSASSDSSRLNLPTDKTPLIIYSLEVTHLKIDQAITYRLRPSDEPTIYPITLLADEIFVVGDNVPVSIDSRNFGPIKQSEVIGIVRWNHSAENRQFEFQSD